MFVFKTGEKMKKAISATLLSGFIFPGFGQIFLGKKGTGLALIIVANIGLAGLIVSAFIRIPQILAKLEPELVKGELDLTELIDLTIQYTRAGGGSLLEMASMVLLTACWFFAIVHAWHIGSQLDKA